MQEGLVFPPYSFINPTTPVASYKWDYAASEANATAAKSFTTKSGGLSSGGKAGVAVSVLPMIINSVGERTSREEKGEADGRPSRSLVQILVIFLIGVGAYSAYRWGWPWYQ